MFGFMSCENDDNLDPVGNWELSTPELISPEDEEELLLQEQLEQQLREDEEMGNY